jgi:urease accessory protein
MSEGLLALRFARDGAGRTRMAARRQRYPLRTTAVLPMGDGGGGALVYLQNAAGAVFGGDRLTVDVTVDQGAEACLAAPSATRLQGGASSHSENRISVGEGGLIEIAPDMLIPHADADHRQLTTIELADGAAAIVAEALAPGRAARGEAQRYRALTLKLEMRAAGRPPLADSLILRPDEADPALEGAMGPAGYAGSVFAVGGPAAADAVADAMDAALRAAPCVHGAAAALASGGGAVARLTAPDAPALRAALYAAWGAARLAMV